MSLMTADPITDKQRNFLSSLAADRDWTGFDVQSVRIIKIVTRPNEDGSLTAFVAKKAVSPVIDALLKAPKIGNTESSTPLSGKAAAQAAIADMPASYKGLKYAIKNTDSKSSPNFWVFYEIKEYKGAKYINRLQGAPGDWNKQFVKYADYAGIAQRIKDSEYVPADTSEHLVGPMAAAARFSDTWQVCSACGAKLSNGKSLADKFGPVCVKKF